VAAFSPTGKYIQAGFSLFDIRNKKIAFLFGQIYPIKRGCNRAHVLAKIIF
jgi:hypothetical protein